MITRFEFGAPLGGGADQFPFDSLLEASAHSAQTSAGEDAAARVRSMGSFVFFLDAAFAGVAPGDFVGTATVSAFHQRRRRTVAHQNAGKEWAVQDSNL
jgi:hypothetical protein